MYGRRPSSVGRWRVRTPITLIVLTVALVTLMCAAVSLGPVGIPLERVLAVLAGDVGLPVGGFSQQDALVIHTIRLPRVLVAMFVGAALGIAGAVMQALFRNALAEPGVTGVSSGAAVGAVAAIASGLAGVHEALLPAAAFAGAVLVLGTTYLLVDAQRGHGMVTVLLVGIALNALCGSVVAAMVANAPDEQAIRSIVYWLQGDLDARGWLHVHTVAGPVFVGGLCVCLFARDLNIMVLSDDQARSAGIDVGRTRRLLVVLASLLTGLAVAVSGVIVFVGLVVPHMVRLVWGPDHRLLLPASALLGASFLVLADTIARVLFAPITLQTGVVTAFLGAPLFLFLVLRSRRGAL